MGLPEATLTGRRRFDPRKIPGCFLWLAADSYFHDGSGNVTVMRDKSGLGNDLYQLAPAQQVTVTANNPRFRGSPTFRFPDKLRYYERIGINAVRGQSAGATPWTIFTVFSRSELPEGNSDNAVVYWNRASGALIGGLLTTPVGGNLRTFTGGDQLTDGLSIVQDEAAIFAATHEFVSGNGWTAHYKNNIPGRTYAGGSFSAATDPRIRVGNFTENVIPGGSGDAGFKGDIAEIILWHRKLSEAERVLAFNQIGGYYNIPIAGGWGRVLG